MGHLADAVRGRLELLGLELPGAALLGFDLYLVAAFAVAAVRRLGVARGGGHRWLLAVGLVALATVIAPATALGAADRLSNGSLVASHVALAALAAVLDRRPGWREAARRVAVGPLRLGGALGRIPLALVSRRAWSRRRGAESAVLAGILAVLAFYALLATFTLPLSYDANTYRLSRVALWLQEGSIAHFPTNDERQSYVGQNADLVMLWLVSFFSTGFPLVHWAQYAAGLLACVAVYELAALVGWRRFWRLAAVAALLGIPSVALQFFTSQTDLFTAATLAAGVTFGLAAIRRRRAAEWILAGIGVSLAVGAKGTVFYFGPGLLLLFVAWLALERAPWRNIARGAAVAAVAVVLLGGFNYVQNWRSFGNPLAPPEAVRGVHRAAAAKVGGMPFQLERVLWQVLEPASNPLVPAALQAPLFERVTADLNASLSGSLEWQRSIGYMDGRLDEDHSSFGIVAVLAILAGGLSAAVGSLRRPRRGSPRVTAMFVSVVAFVVFFCQVSTMKVHQFRYFALIAPFGAVVAIAAFAGSRAIATRAIGGLFVAAQLFTAGLVGLRSEYHGWGALRDPTTSTFYPHWADARALVAGLGPHPLRIALALPYDRWLAPYLRTAAGHRFRIALESEVTSAGTAGRFFAASGDEVLVVAPALLRKVSLDDVAILPASWILRSHQLAIRPLAPGETPRPTIVETEGISSGGWTESRATMRVAGWRGGPLELELQNPTPLARRLRVRSRRGGFELALEPGAGLRLAVELAPRDALTIWTAPPFVPAEHDAATRDRRRLGMLVSPSRAVAEAGVFGDGWTSRRAEIALVNWISGVCGLELANPTPLARELRLTSRLGERRLRLAPGGRARLAIEVLPADRLSLAVEPPYVPTAAGAPTNDARELGVLLGEELLRPPRQEVYR